MKKQIVNRLVIAGMLMIVAAGTAAAQHSSRAVTAKIPFAFAVGKKTLPAGQYDLKIISPSVLMIQSRDGKHAVISLTHSVRTAAGPDLPQLVFNRYEEEYFLSQLWWGGEGEGHQLPKPRREVELARIAAKQAVVPGVARKQ